jgi:hypothetical protein
MQLIVLYIQGERYAFFRKQPAAQKLSLPHQKRQKLIGIPRTKELQGGRDPNCTVSRMNGKRLLQVGIQHKLYH